MREPRTKLVPSRSERKALVNDVDVEKAVLVFGAAQDVNGVSTLADGLDRAQHDQPRGDDAAVARRQVLLHTVLDLPLRLGGKAVVHDEDGPQTGVGVALLLLAILKVAIRFVPRDSVVLVRERFPCEAESGVNGTRALERHGVAPMVLVVDRYVPVHQI